MMGHQQHLSMEFEGNWIIALSDAFIAAAYFLIPFQIMYFFYFSRAYKKVDHLTIGLLFFLFIMLCGGTHVFNIFPEAVGWQAAVKAADAIVSVATVVVMFFLLPKILRWLREQEEHNRCEQHLVAFFTCVLLPRSGTKAELMGIIQRCLRHIFSRDDIVIVLRTAAVYNPVDVSLYQLDWQYVALLPREVFEANRSFFEQVKAFVRSAPVIEPETAPESPKAAAPAAAGSSIQQDTAVLIDMP